MTRTEEFYTSVFEKLTPGSVLLTGNHRLARILRQIYEQTQIQQGRQVWETPEILPWSAWQQMMWDDSLMNCNTEQRRLLGNHQEILVWQGIIEQSKQAGTLIQFYQVACRAHEAWMLMHQWRLSLSEINPYLLSNDTKAFLGWVEKYEQYCERYQWLDTARLPDVLGQYYRSGICAPPSHLILLGFDELTPQQNSLFDDIKKIGVTVEQIEYRKSPDSILRTSYPNTDREFTEAAKWCRQQWAEKPKGTIAVVVNELEQQREKVQRIFDEVLQPGALIDESDGCAYNISLGRPLSEYPLMHTFFLLLDFAAGKLDLGNMGALITSPYISGSMEEGDRRYQLDARLRRQGDVTVSLKSLQYFSGRVDEQGKPYIYTCPLLFEQLQLWQSTCKALKQNLRPGEWADRFTALVIAMGWPANDNLNTSEYQCLQSWKELLSEFSALDSVQSRFSLQGAKQQLKRMASNIVFQPRTPDTRIQIMGMLEAAGQQFDALWIAGLHDEVWPTPPRPNPFLPYIEQQRHAMPRSDAARELQSAMRISDRLIHSASTIVISTPEQDNDTKLRPSRLFADIPLNNSYIVDADGEPLFTDRIFQSNNCERFQDNTGPKLEQGHARGGSTVFKLQAACPFRAFAELRLGARPLSQVEPGLDDAERGTLVHEMLELFWDRIKTRDVLLGNSQIDLQSLVLQIAEEIVDKHAKSQPLTYTERFREIELARLQRYLLQWIEIEKIRDPFSVEATEKKYAVTIAGLTVEVRIDRIDSLEDGSLAVIDYKTGNVKPGVWFDERLDEPQLPLYSTRIGDRLSVVAFAQLRPGSMKYTGVSRDPDQINGVQACQKLRASRSLKDWPSVLSYWENNLHKLAEDFLAGKADVDPKKYPETCNYCELTSLCRVNESDVSMFDDGDEAH